MSQAGTQIKKIKNAPKLRFPEFDEEWTKSTLGEYTKSIASGKSSNINIAEGSYVIYGSTGRIGTTNKFEYSGCKILVARVGANAGNIYRVDGKYGVSDNTLIVDLNENADISFIYNLIEKTNLNRLVFGSGQPLVTGGQLKKLKIVVSSKKEQHKIADFLTVVDGKINALDKKVGLLKKYKKGMMQKIFPPTGGQVPEIRFKDEDGNKYPDWEEKQISKLAIINPKIQRLPDDFIYIDLESVNQGILLYEKRIKKDYAPSRAQRLLKQQDILYQTVRPYQKNNLYFTLSGNYVASTGYAQLRAKENPVFLYHLLHTDKFVNDVLIRCTGTSYPAINSTDLAGIYCKAPRHVEEQQKIADFLTTIDDKIQFEERKLADARRFKKFLLQQMFV